MTDRVQSLLNFHATRNFGTRENLITQQRQARETYFLLTDDEIAGLIEAVLSQAEGPDDAHVYAPLCCLACFRAGSLASHHGRLVELRLFYPGVIYHGAGVEITAELLSLLDEDEYRNHILTALAWIGDEAAIKAFAGWLHSPPAWTSKLYVPPERYAYEAGWELAPEGMRRDLYDEVAHPLIRRSEAAVATGVRVGIGTGVISRKSSSRVSLVGSGRGTSVAFTDYLAFCTQTLRWRGARRA